VFKNCLFIDCDLSELDVTKTIFNECAFLKNSFGLTSFELCYFLKPIFNGIKGSPPETRTDSKFSTSKKSIKFEGKVDLDSILDQIDQFYRDEE